MQSKKILLELVPGRMTVAALHGSRLRDAVRLPFAVESDPNEWIRALRQAAPRLKAHVAEQQWNGSSVVVVYKSPTSTADLHGSMVASPGAAAEAAMLSCADALPYSSLSAVQQAVVLGRDNQRDGRQFHVLVAAEREDIATAIVNLVEQAELKYESAVPLDAFLLCRTANQALKKASDTQGFLYIGEHSSFFIVGGGGRIDFERRLSFDIDAMVATLRRPILRSGGDDGEQSSIELSPEEARAIVQQHGVPDRDTVVQDRLKLTGTQIIPLLQPLLQRLIVELRQSIRFGVSEQDREQFPITVGGPGVCIPGLATTVGDELGLNVTTDDAWSAFDFNDPACPCGELASTIPLDRLCNQLSLQPRELAGRRRIARMKRWLWTGAAAAMVIIGIDFLQYEARLANARQNADVISMSAGDMEALRQTSERLSSTIGALAAVESNIRSETGSGVSFRALMNELSRRTPPSVKLTSLNFQTADNAIVARISGYLFNEQLTKDQTALQDYVEALRSSPLLSEVSLGNVQLGSIAGKDGRRFDAQATVVAAPWEIVDDHYAGASTTDQAGGER